MPESLNGSECRVNGKTSQCLLIVEIVDNVPERLHRALLCQDVLASSAGHKENKNKVQNIRVSLNLIS